MNRKDGRSSYLDFFSPNLFDFLKILKKCVPLTSKAESTGSLTALFPVDAHVKK